MHASPALHTTAACVEPCRRCRCLPLLPPPRPPAAPARFEHLAIEYDEDEIGDLEGQGPEIQGFADAREFDNLLDEFLDSYGKNANGFEVGSLPCAACHGGRYIAC